MLKQVSYNLKKIVILGMEPSFIQEKFRNVFEPNLLKEIEEHAEIKTFKAGTEIIGIGDTIRFMPLILSGNIKVSRVDEKGNEVILYYVGSFESCSMTFTCCMQSRASEIQALAEDDVELILVPNRLMDQWMNQYPTWKSFVMQTIQKRFDELLSAIDQIAFSKLDDRLANYLNTKAKVTDSTLLNLSHTDIAKDLATSRVVVSRLLKKLENEDKLLLYRNQIKLLTEL